MHIRILELIQEDRGWAPRNFLDQPYLSEAEILRYAHCPVLVNHLDLLYVEARELGA